MSINASKSARQHLCRPLALAVTALALCSLVTGCQTPVQLMPTPVAFSTGQLDPFSGVQAKLARTDVPILYTTNRLPLVEAATDPIFTTLPSSQLRVGIAHVRIGDSPNDWESLHRLSLGQDVAPRPIVQLDWLESKGPLPPASDPQAQAHEFFSMIEQALTLSPGRDLVVYVHGVNSTVPRAAAQAAQFQHFATRRVVVVAFMWPSAGSFLRYFTDVGNARASITPFARLLQALAANTSARSINVLSYSAGAQIVSPALAMLAKPQAGEDEAAVRKRLRVGNVYYAAPDLDTRQFVDQLAEYIGAVGRVTAAVNQRDSALRVSQLVNRASRAGRPDKDELDEAQQAFMLKALTRLDFDLLEVDPAAIPGLPPRSHAFWFAHPWVSSDVIALFLLDAAPARRGLEERVGERGARFWTFPPDFYQRIALLFAQAKANKDTPPAATPVSR